MKVGEAIVLPFGEIVTGIVGMAIAVVKLTSLPYDVPAEFVA